MKLAGLINVSLAIAGLGAVCRAGEDYSRRNPAFAPRNHVRDVDAVSPATGRSALQDRRVDAPTSVERTIAPAGERIAPVTVRETTPKKSLPPAAEKLEPAARAPDLSALNHQPASVSTSKARKPTLVSKYQDKLAAAQAVTIGRTPSTERGGETRLNRFVFRHSPAPPVAPVSAVAPGSTGRER